MKHLAIATLTAAALLGATSAVADKGGSCHFHGTKPASQETILGCAMHRKDALAAAGKIDPSWKTVSDGKVEQVDARKGKEWKVTFRNPRVTDAAKQTLYVFLSLPGNVLAANFTGK